MTPFPAGSSHFTDVYRQYRKTYKTAKQRERKKPEIIIWVDYDTYARNDLQDNDKYNQKLRNIPDFKFSYMNFEDFLTLHNTQHLAKWTSICESYNHFIEPMHSSVYEPLF